MNQFKNVTMRKLILLFCLISITINAQEKLIIEYESRMEFDAEAFEKNLSVTGGNVAKQEIIDALKESMTKPNYYKLTLTPNESLFEYVEKIENEQPSDSRVKVKMYAGGNGILYKNLSEKLSLNQQESWDQKFIISDSLETYDWKISKESKEILGFEVRKAEAKIDSAQAAVAWYAPKLPYKNGPESYQGLPGLILEIEVTNHSDDDEQKFIYKAVSLNVDTENEPIERPEKGKEISQSDYEKFNKEQMEKMNEMYEGGVDTD
jgi:GLPGLI family protein